MTTINTDGLTIRHEWDRGDRYIEIQAAHREDGLLLDFFHRTGQDDDTDRGTQRRYDAGEITLDDDECSDLLLLLTAHLERRAAA